MPGAASGHSLSAILALFVRDRAGWIQQNPFKTGLKQQNPPSFEDSPKMPESGPNKIRGFLDRPRESSERTLLGSHQFAGRSAEPHACDFNALRRS
jgi:hypothetical protein